MRCMTPRWQRIPRGARSIRLTGTPEFLDNLPVTSPAPTRFKIGACTVTQTADGVITTFPTGRHAVAATTDEDYDEQFRIACGLGYEGDVERMNREHDVLHTLIAEAMGKPYSPTLHALAHGDPSPPDADVEERIAFLVARLLNVGLDTVLAEHTA